MATDLYFPLPAVVRLLAHARASARHTMTITEVEEKLTCPGGLEWVTDSGVYLMSTGLPGLPGDNGEENLVVYADGFGPATSRAEIRHTDLGPDDFVEHLHFEDLGDMVERGTAGQAAWLWLRVVGENVEFRLARAGMQGAPPAPVPA